MKVLIISPFPPNPAPEATHALYLSEHLAEAGLSVHVLCNKGNMAATHPNVVVHPVMDDWSWSDLPRLVQCLRTCRPDVVFLLYLGWIYNHNSMITFLPTICKTVLSHVPCVTQFEALDDGSYQRSFWTRALRKGLSLRPGGKGVHPWFGTLLRDSARVIALSSPHRAHLVKQYSGAEEKTVIIPPPPLIRFCSDQPSTVRRQVRDAIGVAENDFILVYWGYVYRGKGVETLLKAFRIVCRQNATIRLLIVGDSLEIPNYSASHYTRRLRQFAEKSINADRVTWTGHWENDEGSRYLHASDACVLPFDYGVTLNNSSLAAACTHGLPVIGTELPIGRDEELEHGRNIYLCRPKDPEMLAEAIQMISENAYLRERLRLGALRLSRDWHRWETTMERLIGVLESAVACGKAAGFEKSKSSGGTAEKGSGNKGISPDVGSHCSDDDASLSSSIWHEENAPGNGITPFVTVIVTAYNVEKYLRQCLDSLVHQTLTNIEIIVVNDASTDESLEIAKDYQARHRNLRVVDCKKRVGLASARNLGMRLARGTYIGFVNGADWADPHKYEWMYRRADRDNADIVVAGYKCFEDKTKRFIRGKDLDIWNALTEEFKLTAFHAAEEPRVLVMEPAAWAKLYRRSFLLGHPLEFEEGMHSVEDVRFHFTALWTAKRISLLDRAVSFHRLDRPGRMTGRRDVLQTITAFGKTAQNLAAWDVPDDIWASLLNAELRFFETLLKDRDSILLNRGFFAACVEQLQEIPESAFENFARTADPAQASMLICIRRKWRHAFNIVTGRRWPLFPFLFFILHIRRCDVLKSGLKRWLTMLYQRLAFLVQGVSVRWIHLAGFESRLRSLENNLNRLTHITQLTSNQGESFLTIRRINGLMLLFCGESRERGLSKALRRMERDYYLTQTAAFREDDTVVDVGAHIGVVSIYLAKKYPFIKVYAFEPDPMNYASLTRNIELNGVANVISINKAVTGNGRRTALYRDPWDSGWATIDGDRASRKGTLRTVQLVSMTLDQLFQEYEIRHCRLLKITASGAVDECLKGLTRNECVDLLCGEVDLQDCSRVKLEAESWRIARQHFWRTIERGAKGLRRSWIHALPEEPL